MAWSNNSFSQIRSTGEVSLTNLVYPKEAETIFKKFIPDEFDPNRIQTHNKLTKDWLRNVLTRGTHRDKIAAFSYIVIANPLATTSFLDKLIANVTPNNHNICIDSMVSLKSLFINILMPDRCLYKIEDRDKSCLKDKKKFQKVEKATLPPKDSYEYAIIIWQFEHMLKAKYATFIDQMEKVVGADCVEAVKKAALNTMYELLLAKPELTSRILAIIINKVGDRSRVFSSAVIHKIRNVISKKPVLLPELISEIQRFILRPGIPERAKYYAISLLSCIQYPKRGSHREKLITLGNQEMKSSEDIASQVVKVYTGFFKSSVSEVSGKEDETEEKKERLLTTILTGLRRAAPFSKSIELGECIKDLFLLVHTAKSLKLSIQSLTVLQTLIKVHKSLADESEDSYKLENHFFNTLWVKLLDPNLRQFSGKKVLLKLIYDSLLIDDDNKRVLAFIVRLLQLALSSSDFGYVSAILITIDKIRCLEKYADLDILELATQAAVESEDVTAPVIDLKRFESDDDEEEQFSDASSVEVTKTKKESNKKRKVVSTWIHRKQGDALDAKKEKTCKQDKNSFCRDPRSFAIPKYCVYYLLRTLASSPHPTIALYANSIIQGSQSKESIKFDGDPFVDFSTCRFLEKFSMKKPKEKGDEQNAFAKKPSAPTSESTNILANFKGIDIESLPPDEQFIHKYLSLADKLGLNVGQGGRKRFQEVEDDDFDSFLEKHERGLCGIMMENEKDSEFSDEEEDEDDDSVVIDDGESSDDMDDGEFEKMDFDSSGEEFDDDDEDDNEDDDSDADMENLTSAGKRQKLESLFASADEVGHLFEEQETATGKKAQRGGQRRGGPKRRFGKMSNGKKK